MFHLVSILFGTSLHPLTFYLVMHGAHMPLAHLVQHGGGNFNVGEATDHQIYRLLAVAIFFYCHKSINMHSAYMYFTIYMYVHVDLLSFNKRNDFTH